MLIGTFTERPYQDPSHGISGAYLSTSGQAVGAYDNTSIPRMDLATSNGLYNPRVARDLYNRYLDEKVYAEEVGFDAVMLNEHHATMFCMGSVINVEAAVLARITKKAKIVLAGNVLPIWDDPMFLAEQLAEIDVISGGRLVAGWVRGTGRESVAHDAQAPYNWERFQEGLDFIVKTWTTPGPFKWQGKHYQYRYVNPWTRPFQQPHPQIWIPGVISKNTVEFAARHRYPYIMLGGAGDELHLVRQAYDFYTQVAAECGYKAGPQHFGYMVKVHCEETDEKAYAVGRKLLQGPANPFLEGNQGEVRPYLQALPGLTSRTNLLESNVAQRRARGHVTPEGQPKQPSAVERDFSNTYARQVERQTIITGTPNTVVPKLKNLLETLRCGSLFLWDGDGAMDHNDSMRSLKLLGEEVLPALREIGHELDLPSSFEVDPSTNKPYVNQAEPYAPPGTPGPQP